MKRKFVVNEHKYRYEEGAHYSYSIHNNNKKKKEKSESFYFQGLDWNATLNSRSLYLSQIHYGTVKLFTSHIPAC